jgi:hypothetical protein
VRVPPPPEKSGRSRGLLAIELTLENRFEPNTATPAPTATPPMTKVATINHHHEKPPLDRGGVAGYGAVYGAL